MGETTVNKDEAAIPDQTQILPKSQILFVISIISLAQFVAFVDQNGIGVLLPSIADDLHAQATITWAGTSALIANTVFQVLYGRASDLFGRKKVLLAALVLLSLSDLACGLAVNGTMLYIFRGLAGVANGGITSLVMMVVSDVVTLRERGKYQGILGIFVGLGNAIGPLIGASLALYATWRGLFWLLSPLCLIVAVAAFFYLPSNMPKVNFRQTISVIDWVGLFFGSSLVIFLLIPISSGGHNGVAWDSPIIIAFFCVGGFCLIAFLVTEWKFARLPMMPLGLWKSRSVAAMLVQSFCLGMANQTYLYFLPLYFQNVRGVNPLIAAAMQLPLVGAQAPSSWLAGLYMSKYNRYIEVMYVGFGLWTLGAGLLIMADRSISYGWIAFFLFICGIGTGMTFQPLLTALQAHCPKAMRAVITSNRNFLRNSGGASGLAIASCILANVLRASLPPSLSYIADSTFAAPPLSDFDPQDQTIISDAYTDASRAVFIFCTPVVGLTLLLTLLVNDNGLYRAEEKKEQPRGTEANPTDPGDGENGVVVENASEEHKRLSEENEKDGNDMHETSELPGDVLGGDEKSIRRNIIASQER